ncbi:MAG: hypothetical protein AVDCRST_MAG34-43, partial [uncultured Nocardioidaceae bacterium]
AATGRRRGDRPRRPVRPAGLARRVGGDLDRGQQPRRAPRRGAARRRARRTRGGSGTGGRPPAAQLRVRPARRRPGLSRAGHGRAVALAGPPGVVARRSAPGEAERPAHRGHARHRGDCGTCPRGGTPAGQGGGSPFRPLHRRAAAV